MNNKIFLALGSNLGNREENLINSIKKLEENNVKFVKTSPVYRTPALLLDNSPNYWNIPFSNCVIQVETKESPENLLKICKKIEHEMGRDFSKKWAPRTIDIDILLYKDFKIETENLIIPHKALFERYFLLDALSFLDLNILKNQNYYSKNHQPVFMGIMNITPNSFSDGGVHNNIEKFIEDFELWENKMVGIIDIGAESTNPKAAPITYQEELERLNPIFNYLKNKKFSYFKPSLSIDTYHYETAKIAIENGFDIINDVSGLNDKRMIELLKSNEHVKYVLMHSLSVPPRSDLTIEKDENIIKVLQEWLKSKLKIFENDGIDLDRIIFDSGLGFGKNEFQSINILQEIEQFQKYKLKILIGHSRKSFIKKYNSNSIGNRDFESLAISLKIANKVDIIRTHTPLETQEALLFFNSI